jgi:hypothetical protein
MYVVSWFQVLFVLLNIFIAKKLKMWKRVIHVTKLYGFSIVDIVGMI